MRTLIVTGSPRKRGNTADCVKLLVSRLEGETEILSLADRRDITPCRDCRYCFEHPECAVRDGMQEIYRKLDEADRIVFAAPVYFYNIPGAMKMVLDRLQVYWAGQVRGDKLPMTKKGGIILVGGAPESEKQFLGTIQTLQYMLGDLGAECVGIATMGGSDQRGLEDRPDMQKKICRLAEQLHQ